MNILFLTKSFGIGGVEIVTLTLAKEFKRNGHNVSIFSFYKADNVLESRLPHNIPLYIGKGYKNSVDNVAMLRDIFIKNEIGFVVNQWGLPFLPIRVIDKARKGLDIKVISVYHNQVDTNGKLKAMDQAVARCNHPIVIPLLKLMREVVRFVTSHSMRYVYNHSDIYEVLSPSYVSLFKSFTGISEPHKLVVQTNPITIQTTHDAIGMDSLNKQKEIIYVGRLDFVQKRVHRVIDTWNYLEERFPEWKLTIVGDGGDRGNLENHAKALGLKRVAFEGFKDPVDYYKRASILMLTSDFEGFPLVLAECMSFGVIPVVYNSYAAVSDIINDGKDGIVIPFYGNGYDANGAANMVADIMGDDARRNNMALAAREKSKKYSVYDIYKDWITILGT